MSEVHNNTANRGSLESLLTCSQAAAMLSVSVPTFWRRVADGTVPKPLKFGRLSRWPQSDILEAIEAAKARRVQFDGE